jgi:hypothetical protein
VTENNAEAAQLCRGDDVLPSLQLLAQRSETSSQAVLFQAAVMGTFKLFYLFIYLFIYLFL